MQGTRCNICNAAQGPYASAQQGDGRDQGAGDLHGRLPEDDRLRRPSSSTAQSASIVSQLVRSPGVYYGKELDKTDKVLLSTTVIPYRGAWLEYETDANDIFYVRIDKNRKIPITSFIRAIGVKTDAEIKELFGEDPLLLATLDKDPAHSADEALIEIYKKMRPGEPPSVESATSLMDMMFFDMRRYDISAVGRYKYNKKLDIARRITGHKLLETVTDPMTGEVVAEADTMLTREKATEISARGINNVIVESADGNPVKVFGNGMVFVDDFKDYLGMTAEELGIKEKVRFTVLKEIIDSGVQGEELKKAFKARHYDLIPKTHHRRRYARLHLLPA